MSKILGTALALGITGAAMSGVALLIAGDFAGGDAGAALWSRFSGLPVTASVEPAPAAPQPATPEPGFKPEKQITFFESVPIEGTSLMVHTGADYDTVEDVRKKRPRTQWCYLTLGSGTKGVSGHVNLGFQSGDDPVEYTGKETFLGLKLEGYGLTPDRLVIVARTHCRFGSLDPLA